MTRSGRRRGVAWRWLIAAATLALSLSVGLARPAGAATRFVTTTGNDTSNTCLASGSPCKTITHALTQAVTGDTISVAAGTYNLALGETFPLTITTNLTLTGAGAAGTILDATAANQRVITISSGTVTIAGVTITGGAVSCTNTGSSFCNATGGGLFNAGTATLTNVTASGNTASCTNSGGNFCGAFGGGLRNDGGGTLTVTASTVSGNTANCTNGGCNAQGGGLFNEFGSTLTVTASTVNGNTMSCTNSGSGTCIAAGGGLMNHGTLTVTNSTVTANTVTCSGTVCFAAGGGLSNDGTLTHTNSTVSGNTAICTSSGGNFCGAFGGGLRNDGGGTLTVTASTVSANTAICSGNSCRTSAGGLDNIGGTTTLLNTLVAKQLAGPDCVNSATLASNGFNLDSDGTCDLTQPGDKPNVSNPLLGPLQDNGGPTSTHALLPGSPAIDAGTNAGCPPTDQRGFVRPVDGDGNSTATCDIGAYELVAIATTLAAAVLPTERTGLVGGIAMTAFATILNTGADTALGCALAPFAPPVAATFLYQTTDPLTNALTGTANTPATIPPGQGQSFVFAFTPTAPFPPTEVQLSFACTNSAPAPIISGVNTFRLRATATPAADVVALAATGPPNDGIVRLASVGAFAVATVNLGAPGLMTVSADTAGVALPVTLTLCETNPATSVCLAPPTPTVQTQINSGATPTFGVFVSADTPIPFDPATSRIQVHLEGGGGGGGTSVAVCTVPLCP